jgi:hypothetical protein
VWHRYRFDKRAANYRAAVVIVTSSCGSDEPWDTP